MEKKSISLDVSYEDIKDKLRKAIEPEYDDNLIVDCVMSLTQDDPHKLGVLFKALLGISPKHQYEVGDEVVINLYGISTWDFSNDEMNQRGLTYLVGNVMCINGKIVGIDPWAENPYNIRVEYYHKDSAEREDLDALPPTKIKEQHVNPRYVIGLQEDWPEM